MHIDSIEPDALKDRGTVPRFHPTEVDIFTPLLKYTPQRINMDSTEPDALEDSGTVPRFHLTEAERFIPFTDAVVAISMTLLILPLMEAASESEQRTIAEYFSEKGMMLFGFFISFRVSQTSWCIHDYIFRHVRVFTKMLRSLNFLWLLGMVCIPVVTSLAVNAPDDDRYQSVPYFVILICIQIVSLLIVITIINDARTWKGSEAPISGLLVSESVLISLLVLGLGLSFSVPPNYGLLFAMLTFTESLVTKFIFTLWSKLKG